MVEIALVILAFLLLAAGLVGSVVPALPGPPLSYAGLLLLQWSGRGGFGLAVLLIWAAVTIAVTVIDSFLPAWMTRRFGGSRAAVFGSVVGLVVGMIFFAPVGLLLGPFLGALIGELISNNLRASRAAAAEKAIADGAAKGAALGGGDGPAVSGAAGNIRALKVALGVFAAFILGTGAKLIVCALMILMAIRAVFA